MGKMNRVGRMLVATSVLATAGCASYQAAGPPRAALPLTEEIRQYYHYPATEPSAQIRSSEQHPAYSVKNVALSVPGSLRPIQIVWFAPIKPEPRPLILISPIKGSDTLVVDGCARDFASRGYNAAIVKRTHFDFKPAGPLTQTEDFLHSAVTRHRQALDWLMTQPGIDASRIGTFGISYGGILNAILAAVEPRAKCHVIDLAGGPLPAVMRTSLEHSLRRDWSRSRDSHDLTDRELHDALRGLVRTDPVKLAPYVDRDRVLMLIARFDRSVPTRYQLKLWQALGKPRADFVPLGHYTSILALPAHRDSIMKFFEEKLNRAASVALTNTVHAASN